MTDRDPAVARALRELPVPDHAPGFWERLDARLAAEDARPFDPAVDPSAGERLDDDRLGALDDGLPDVDERVATAELPAIAVLRPDPAVPARHRHRFLAAAAVVAAFALATGLVLRDRSGSGTGTVEQAGTTTVPEAASSFTSTPETAGTTEVPAPPTTPPTTTSAGSPAGAASPEEAVLAWVEALAAGDTARAVELLGPASQRFIRSQGGTPFEAMLESQEGYGAWAASPDRATSEVEIPGAGVVVVLTGTHAAEGMPEQRTEAVPTVQGDDGSWYVEHLAFSPQFGGRPEVVTPEADVGVGNWTGQPPDAAFRATSADPGATFWFALDGGPAVASDTGTWDPPGELASGTHLLVVATVGNGHFGATAGTFVVEG